MDLFFTCPSCRKRLKVSGTVRGSQVCCPGCGTPSAVPRDDFPAGTRIAGFEIVRPLGKGGMGEVYLARQVSMGREVALKVLSAEFAAKAEARERFLKEVRLAAKLEHPHIVTAHDAGEDDGLCYMAMSFVPGSSLATRLKPGARLGEREALRMMRKLAQALDYAWNRFHLIHRDIKPANILFDAGGEPKLADLGLSKSLDDAEAMTMSGEVMGTPNYMSPEQAEGRSDLDFRADVYSLGATFYHAVTGHMPFAGSSIMVVLRKQAIESLPDPREFNPELSEHFVRLLQLMLAKRREDRHADWAALIRDIDDVLASKPPSLALPGEGNSVLIRKGPGHGAHRKIVIPKGGLHHEKAAAPAPATPRKSMKPREKALVFGGVAAVVLAALAAGLAIHVSQQRAEGRRAAADREARQAAEAREREGRAEAEKTQAEIWQVAADFAKANPDAFDRAISNFEEAGKRLAGTRYEMLARQEIERVRAARQSAVDRVFLDLEARAKGLADQDNPDGAADVFAKYAGDFAADLSERRDAAEKHYRARAAEAAEKMSQAEREAVQKERGTLSAIADALYAGDLAAARQACGAFLDDAAVPGGKTEMRRVAGWLDQVAAADKTLLGTFEAQKGMTVPLTVDGEKTEVRVAGMRGDRIQIERRKGVGWATAELAPAQLAPDEQYARLKDRLAPEALGLWAGAMMLRSRRPDLAAKHFENTGPLATALLEKAEGAKGGQREADAEAAFARLLQTVGLPSADPSPAALAERIQPGKITLVQIGAALRQLDAYAEAFNSTQHARTRASILSTLRFALETVQKNAQSHGLAPGTAAKGDEFAQRVLAARAKTGVPVRVAPQAGAGCLEVNAALAALKPGTQFRYSAAPIGYAPSSNVVHEFNRDGVIVEAEAEAGMIRARIAADDCIVRGVPRIRLSVAAARRPVVTDCMLFSLDLGPGSQVALNNCVVVGHVSLQKDSRLEARRCTFLALGGGENAFATFGDILLRECLVYAAGTAIVINGERRIDIRDSIVHGAACAATVVNSKWSSPPGQYNRLASVQAIPRAVLENCSSAKPLLSVDRDRNIFRLAEGSPGRGALPGGGDLGAETGEDALPAWPGRPSARSGLARAAAEASADNPASSAVAEPDARQTLDLLALCDPVLDRAPHMPIQRWQRIDGALACTGSASAKIAAPVAVRARSCEMEIEFERLSESARLNMDTVFDAERVVPMYIDGPGRLVLDGKAGPACPESRGGRHRVVVRVDRGMNGAADRVTATFGDEPLMDWRGDLAAYAIVPGKSPQFDDQFRPALYASSGQYRFTAWKLRVFEGEATLLREAAPAVPAETPPAARSLGSLYTNAVGGEMVAIPPGEFLMGSTAEERDWAFRETERLSGQISALAARKNFEQEGGPPVRTRIAKGFWMGRTEVTVGQFKLFANATRHLTVGERKGSSFSYDVQNKTWTTVTGAQWRDPKLPAPTLDTHPVTCIAWTDADAFCTWLNGRERAAGRLPAGYRIRLPAEAEWEYACRGGRPGSRFWWGDAVADGDGRLNWMPGPDRSAHPEPVDRYGIRGRNGFGLADMLGNAREWCLDGFDPAGAHEAPYLKDMTRRVLRGGAFGYTSPTVRCAARDSGTPGDGSHARYGFRVCCGPDLPSP